MAPKEVKAVEELGTDSAGEFVRCIQMLFQFLSGNYIYPAMLALEFEE